MNFKWFLIFVAIFANFALASCNSEYLEPEENPDEYFAKVSYYCDKSRNPYLKLYSVYVNKFEQKWPIYAACYDVVSKVPVFAHQFFMGYLHVNDTRPNAEFMLDTKQTGLISLQADAYKKSSVFDRFKQLFGNDNKYVRNSTEPVIARGQLVPFSALETEAEQAATFRYMNVLPMFQSIKAGNWLKIENWVNKLPTSGYEIVTGAYDFLQIDNQNEIFLKQNDLLPMFPIRKWLYKIVSKIMCTIFVVYNNPYETTDERICDEIACPEDIAFDASSTAYCCKAHTFSDPSLQLTTAYICGWATNL